MRTLLLVSILLALTPTLRSQTLQNLDKKFGIKGLRLETEVTAYRSKIAFKYKEKDGKAYYKYTGSDMSEILDIPVEQVGLIFYKNKLYLISVTFKKITEMDEKELYHKLAELFGKPTVGQTSEKDVFEHDWGYQWETEKVFMQYSKYSDSSSANPGQTEIFMYSNRIHKQISTDNF